MANPALGFSYKRCVDPAALPILSCPRCHTDAPFKGLRTPRCRSCGLEPTISAHGVLDLVDSSAGEAPVVTTEQRLMESEVVARLYDRFWRPSFVRLFAGKGAGASVGGLSGELFIHKHGLGLDDRAGPWLDLSCGPGAFARALAAAAPGALIVGLDISRAMLDVAAQRTAGYSNVVLVRADAHALPFVDAAFAGVNNAGALHAYDDPELVFREIRRVLAPGGHYVGSTFAEAPSLFGRLAARAAGIRRFQPSELRAWLQRIGFADYEDVRLGGALVFRVRRP